MSNTGSMSPIVPGAPSPDVSSVFTPPEVTALSLMEYAEIMGINPIQFMSGDSTGYFPSTGCTDRWRQYAWQDEAKTSRDELAREIRQAELDIASELGYMPGLTWYSSELVNYPKYYRRAWTTVSGTKVDGYYKSVKLRQGKLFAPGLRTATYVGTASFASASMAYADDDGDGFNETIVITVPTTYTSIYDHKVYYSNMGGGEEWEIRPATKKLISSNTLEVRMPVWLLFKPELLAALPGDSGYTDIDPSVQANLVAAVDVYYETADPSQGNLAHWNESAQLIDDTDHTTQLVAIEGHVVHRTISDVTITPATYDAGTGAFTVVPFTVAREPDYIELAYCGGDYIEDSRRGMRIVPHDLAQAIAWMATARLPRPLCTQCQNVKDKEKRLRTELAYSVDGTSGDVRFVTIDVLRNPFGTKLGEVEAWKIVKNRIKEGDISPKVAVF